jgi:hypothetical protein
MKSVAKLGSSRVQWWVEKLVQKLVENSAGKWGYEKVVRRVEKLEKRRDVQWEGRVVGRAVG